MKMFADLLTEFFVWGSTVIIKTIDLGSRGKSCDQMFPISVPNRKTCSQLAKKPVLYFTTVHRCRIALTDNGNYSTISVAFSQCLH